MFETVTFGDMTVEGSVNPFLEQFDIRRDGRAVAYVRVRHGHCTVDYPDPSGITILAYSAGYMDEPFRDEVERQIFLSECISAVRRYEASGKITPEWRVGLALDAKRGSPLARELMDTIKDR